MPRHCLTWSRIAALSIAATACSEDVMLGGGHDTAGGDGAAGSSTSTGAPTPSETTAASVDDGTGSTSDDDDTGVLDGPKFDAAVPDGGTLPSDCLEEANYIYVLADEAPPMNGTQGEMSLFRFVVDTLTFEQAVPIAQDCHLEGAISYTQSFGVDRKARAYMSGSGAMLTVDLADDDPTCEYLSDPVPAFGYASLSYVGTDPEDPSSEVLYMHENYIGYGWLDPVADPPHFTGIAATKGFPSPMPLAGTSDGRLFALEPDWASEEEPMPVHKLVQLDPTTGALVTELGDIEGIGFYAPYIAFYGGDIFLFDSNYAEDPIDISPTVRRFDVDDDDGNGEHDLEVLLEWGDQPAPFLIRGAASPTCLPLTPQG